MFGQLRSRPRVGALAKDEERSEMAVRRQRATSRRQETADEETQNETQGNVQDNQDERSDEGDDGEDDNLPATTPGGTRSLADPSERNAFEAYGDQVSTKMLVGTLLKFNKGDWIKGDDEDIEPGTRFVANMDQLMVGWIKWVDNRPDQQIMGAVVDRFQPPRRGTLGDTDEDQWETDNDGKPRDPWQYSNYIVFKPVGRKAKEDELLTFATSSKGGIGAIGELCKSYGKEMRTHPEQYPIVEIGVNKYKHSNPEWGWIKVPTLKLVGWEKASLFARPEENSEPEAEASPAAASSTGSGRTTSRRRSR